MAAQPHHITSVSFSGLKGQESEVQLGTKTLIVGDNFSGKTTILNAVELALEGGASDVGVPARPWVKSDPLINLHLRSSPLLRVAATWSDGAQSTFSLAEGKRGVRRGPEGAPFRSLWADLQGSGERAAARLAAELGGQVVTPAAVAGDDAILLPAEVLVDAETLRKARKAATDSLKHAQQSREILEHEVAGLPRYAAPVEPLEATLQQRLKEAGYASIDEVRKSIQIIERAEQDAAELARSQRLARADSPPKKSKKAKKAEKRAREAAVQAAQEAARAAAQAERARIRRRARGEALEVILAWQQERVDNPEAPQCCLLCRGSLPTKQQLKKMQAAANKLKE